MTGNDVHKSDAGYHACGMLEAFVEYAKWAKAVSVSIPTRFTGRSICTAGIGGDYLSHVCCSNVVAVMNGNGVSLPSTGVYNV